MVKTYKKPSLRKKYTELFLILNSEELTTNEILNKSITYKDTTPNNISQFLKQIDKEGLLLIDKNFKHKKFKYSLNYKNCFLIMVEKLDSIYKNKKIDLIDPKTNQKTTIAFKASSIWETYDLTGSIYQFFKQTFQDYLNLVYNDPIPGTHKKLEDRTISTIFDYFDLKIITFDTLIDYYIYSIHANNQYFLNGIDKKSSIAVENLSKWCKYYTNFILINGLLVKFQY